jgi:hypothetical protein
MAKEKGGHEGWRLSTRLLRLGSVVGEPENDRCRGGGRRHSVMFTLWHSGGSGVLHTPFPPAYSVSDGLVGLTGGLLLLYIAPSLPKPPLEKIIICCGIAATAVVVSDLVANAILAHQGGAPSSAVVFKGTVSDTLCAVVLLALALYFRPPNALTQPVRSWLSRYFENGRGLPRTS